MKENEQNQKPSNLRIHDVAVIHKIQRTGEEGKKLGYNFYAKDSIGVVTELTDMTVTLKLSNGEEYNYDSSVEDEEYYFTVGVGSEIEYERLIEKDIASKVVASNKAALELKEAMTWLHDFKERVSVWNRIMRAVKLSN